MEKLTKGGCIEFIVLISGLFIQGIKNTKIVRTYFMTVPFPSRKHFLVPIPHSPHPWALRFASWHLYD